MVTNDSEAVPDMVAMDRLTFAVAVTRAEKVSDSVTVATSLTVIERAELDVVRVGVFVGGGVTVRVIDAVASRVGVGVGGGVMLIVFEAGNDIEGVATRVRLLDCETDSVCEDECCWVAVTVIESEKLFVRFTVRVVVEFSDGEREAVGTVREGDIVRALVRDKDAVRKLLAEADEVLEPTTVPVLDREPV